MTLVYMDNNATTQVAPEVIEAMEPFFHDLWGNPSSMHSFGGQVARHMEEAREKVAALLHADPSEIIFTSCGSESDNMALRGSVAAHGGHPHIITSCVEHPAVLGVARYLQKHHGCRLTELPVNEKGQISLDHLCEAIDHDTLIVSLMWANNETGTIYPMDKIAQIVKEQGKVLHTDAVQVAGKLSIDVRKTPVDMLSISGHKLHTPKGIGALYIRKGTKVSPFMIGGHQEHGKRGGTENVPYIVGLGRACELAESTMREEQTRVAAMRDKLEAGLLKSCTNTRVNGDIEHRLPNTTNISFEFVEGEAILLHMDRYGICASSGSACTSGSLEPSHVIRAMGVSFTAAHGSIRFSLSRYNQEADINHVLENMPRIIKTLRELSPFVPK